MLCGSLELPSFLSPVPWYFHKFSVGSLPFCKCLLTRPIIHNLGLSLCSINWQISWRKYVFHLSFYSLCFCGLKQQSLFCNCSQFLWVKNLERFSSGYCMKLQSAMWSWDSARWNHWGQALHVMWGLSFQIVVSVSIWILRVVWFFQHGVLRAVGLLM